MRKLLWMVMLLAGYFWLVTSGREEFVLETGKTIYQAFVSWFDDAELDFQLKKEKISKKRSRRWD